MDERKFVGNVFIGGTTNDFPNAYDIVREKTFMLGYIYNLSIYLDGVWFDS